ncbi:MAG: hypothetical protein KDD60_11120, partial [Bdellovibrionales bacterium]|nr:hypothetical protein [Bdellovibrionales bacterium]
FSLGDRLESPGSVANLARSAAAARVRRLDPRRVRDLRPQEVEHLAGELVTEPKTISVSVSGLANTVAHNMFSVSDSQKNPLLLDLVEKLGHGSAIVFTRTKRRAKGVSEFLNAAGKEAVSLQGNLSQSKRRDAIDGFRTGHYKVLVATDIAARGIDISRVSHVVNYDMPDTVEAYTHRTGRTGRANRLGDALSFATSSDRQILRRIQRQLCLTIGELPVPGTLPQVKRTQQKRDEARESHSQSTSAARGERRERRDSPQRRDYRSDGQRRSERSPRREESQGQRRNENSPGRSRSDGQNQRPQRNERANSRHEGNNRDHERQGQGQPRKPQGRPGQMGQKSLGQGGQRRNENTWRRGSGQASRTSENSNRQNENRRSENPRNENSRNENRRNENRRGENQGNRGSGGSLQRSEKRPENRGQRRSGNAPRHSNRSEGRRSPRQYN